MIKSKSISKRILAVMLAAVTVIAFTPAIAFTQSVSADVTANPITIANTEYKPIAGGSPIYLLNVYNNNVATGAVTTSGATSTNYNIMAAPRSRQHRRYRAA